MLTIGLTCKFSIDLKHEKVSIKSKNHQHTCIVRKYGMSFNDIYRITAVLNVETDIITSMAARLT